MIALFRKEISSFFSSFIGYLVIAVFLLLTSLFLFVFPSDYNLFDYGYATLDSFFRMAPLVFLFLIPALTMRSFADEKRSGTIEILMTKPLTDLQIVCAKYLASFCLLIIALLPTLVYVYTIQNLSLVRGNVDMGGVWGSYIGLLLVGAGFVSIGLFMSSLTKNQIVSFVLAVILCGFMYFGWDLVAGFFGQGEYFVSTIGMASHYDSMGRGVLDFRDLIYFLSLVVLFSGLTLLSLQARKLPVKKRLVNLALVCFSVFIVNLLAGLFVLRLDMTGDKRYTLHATSKKLIKELDGSVYVKVYLDGDLPSGFKRLRNSTKDLLLEFQAYNKEIKYDFVNLNAISNEKNRTAVISDLMERGAQPINLQVRERGGTSRKMIFPYAEIRYQGKTELVELMQSQVGLTPEETLNTSVRTLEYQLISALYSLQLTEKASVAFIRGHGELDPIHTVEAAMALSGFYDVRPLTMRGNPKDLLRVLDNGDVVPAYTAIVIAQPKEEFSLIDKWTIDQYAMRGGKILWMLDVSDASMDSIRRYGEQVPIEYNTGLSDLLFKYGVRLNSNLILDLNCAPVPLVVGYVGDQPQTDFFNYYFLPVLLSMNHHPIVKNLNPVRSEFVSTIDLIDNDIDKTILMTSSPYTRTTGLLNTLNFDVMRINPDPKEFNKGEQIVGVLLEGSFESAFRNRMAYGLEQIDIPMADKSRGTQMIVISDGDIIKNQFNNAQNYPYPLGYDPYTQQTYANKAFIVNCVNYLCDGSLLLDLRVKDIRLRLLDKPRIQAEKTKWIIINVATPVFILSIFGIAFTLIRKRRYAK